MGFKQPLLLLNNHYIIHKGKNKNWMISQPKEKINNAQKFKQDSELQFLASDRQ
jgi:hypothetical protein